MKIFRRIRQKLLIDYKLGRYLLYALGEIILVVIGILIALQINNRNQEAGGERGTARHITGDQYPSAIRCQRAQPADHSS